MPGALMASSLAVWAAMIAALDWQKRRVPNMGLALVGAPAILALAVDGTGLIGARAWESFAGLLFAGGILLPGYIARQVGAGDLKLAAVMGLVLGIRSSLRMMLVAGLVIGLMALVVRIRLGRGASASYRLPGAVALVFGFEWSLWAAVASGAVNQ